MNISAFALKKNVFAAAAALGFGLASAGVSAATVFNDFAVDPSAYAPGKSLFTADKITGNYSEVITLNTTDNTFNASLQWSATSFVKDDGTTALLANRTGLGNDGGYGIYALYQASGTFSTMGGVTHFVTNAGSGGLSFWLDPQQDASFTRPGTGSGAWTVGGLDDTLLATGTPQSGSGTLGPNPACSSGGGEGINCGSFGTTVSFALTPSPNGGSDFFVLPNPFYNLSFQSGQFNDFSLDGTQQINGSLDVVFSGTPATVPEPGTLALLGLAAVGLGVSARRRAR